MNCSRPLYPVSVLIVTVKPIWPLGIRLVFAATCLSALWVRIPPGHGDLSVVIIVYRKVQVSASG
jgi:hypothetical protein